MATVFNKNVNSISVSYPQLAEKLKEAHTSQAYSEVKYAKTGTAVPVFASKQAVHSLYNPEKEAERLVNTGTETGFMLFCGLGAGIHIRYFLKKNPQSVCAITEADYPSFKSLLHLLDYTDIFNHSRVILLPACTDPAFESAFIRHYIPALHGNFNCLVLRTWKLFFAQQTEQLLPQIETYLAHIRADFSVQAHFGKIWMRNIFFNLQTAEKIQPVLPSTDTSKTALILGAGPSLEKTITVIHNKRNDYVLFCTDTAFPTVSSHNIIPDFFISLDPQHISYAHTIHYFSAETTGIFDLCADTATVKRFQSNGNTIFFTAGAHPLAQYAAHYSPLPPLNTTSGTVAVSAYHAAQALGFSRIICSGMDFAYTNGQAYARGTYLSHQYAQKSTRIIPEETAFVRLMFRTETTSIQTPEGITYTTPVLDSYRKAFSPEQNTHPIWKETDFTVFPYKKFIQHFAQARQTQDETLLQTLLPYKAWYNQYGNEKFDTWELALDDISVYT